ncbi:hypothetical protein [Achromobacter sp. EB05]|uniref:hypothetical protein n=1 Tax=Achromobacter sp. EB05 TaxID=3142974 RepID=UPI00378387C0
MKFLSIISILSGIISSACWFYASKVKIGGEEATAKRVKENIRKGEKPNYASVTLDGWDMSATFEAQALWNSRGAFFAAASILSQAISSL